MYVDKEYDAMIEADRKAKREGTILNRFINVPIADGHAYYIVTKINKRTVRIQHKDVGDGWSVSYWGAGTIIDKEHAEQQILGRDKFDELFSKG